jgi:hypothetical protein
MVPPDTTVIPQFDAMVPRPVSRATAVSVLLMALLATTVLHLTGIGGDFLCDDFVHIQWIAEADGKGDLLGWVIERFLSTNRVGQLCLSSCSVCLICA